MQLEQGIKNMQEILSDIDQLKIQLPSFQRDYEWDEERVFKLLNSIQKRQYAGTLLFWEVDNPVIKFEPFKTLAVEKIQEHKDSKPEYLVLDGQQRLTSCYNIFYNRKMNKKSYTYYFDLKKAYQKFVLDVKDSDVSIEDFFKNYNDKEKLNKHFRNYSDDIEDFIVREKYTEKPEIKGDLIPLSFFKSNTEFSDKIYSYKKSIEDSEYQFFIETKITEYFSPFFDYQFAVATFSKKIAFEEVCEMFQNLNSTGLSLNIFDITAAKLLINQCDISETIDNLLENPDFSSLRFYLKEDKSDVLVLVSLLAGKGVKKQKLPINLDGDIVNTYWDKAINGLRSAIEMLGGEFGLGCDTNFSITPYKTSVLIVAGVLAKLNYWEQNNETRSKIKAKIRKWLYTVSLNGRFGNSTEGKFIPDLEGLLKWIQNDDATGLPYLDKPIYIGEPSLIKRTGAVGKTILAIFNSNRPTDLYENEPVGVGMNIKKCDIHHLFPKDSYDYKYKDKVNSVFNFTFLLPATNRTIKKKRTLDYIKTIEERKTNNFEYTMRGHFINEKSIDALRKEEFETFIEERSKEVQNFLEKIGVHVEFSEEKEAE